VLADLFPPGHQRCVPVLAPERGSGGRISTSEGRDGVPFSVAARVTGARTGAGAGLLGRVTVTGGVSVLITGIEGGCDAFGASTTGMMGWRARGGGVGSWAKTVLVATGADGAMTGGSGFGGAGNARSRDAVVYGPVAAARVITSMHVFAAPESKPKPPIFGERNKNASISLSFTLPVKNRVMKL